ncbi:MAG: glutamine--fructose-6-phosphate transaminase (isomerizing) [Acidiferrobacterales bacterium]|nr:glutamine--fructose-6-phosphate transaminase (isomerizing) [Acidiferrobacterales bacterium]
MCGIVGATAQNEVVNLIVDGLRTLEYRGYDSAGIAAQNAEEVMIRKEPGKISALQNSLVKNPVSGNCAIGHTRWATHGKPNRENAHPHVSGNAIAVVHNGIIENSAELKQLLVNCGYRFASETDSETIPHLVDLYLSAGNSFFEACRKAISHLEGSYAVAITFANEPGKIIAARKGSPLIVAQGEQGFMVVSDVIALQEKNQIVYYLEEGDIAEVSADNCEFYDSKGKRVSRTGTRLGQSECVATKKDFDSFMQKEIFEQPEAVRATLARRLVNGKVSERLFDKGSSAILDGVENIHIVACGTSLNAGHVAKYWLESVAGIPCQVEIASEYRYRNPVVPPKTLFLSISQSGETADTLAALRFANDSPYLGSLGICNTNNSSLFRESEAAILTKAGVEVGVASTKALTTQLTALALLVLKIGELRNTPDAVLHNIADALLNLPSALDEALKTEEKIKEVARSISRHKSVLFLGRGHHYPVAVEGALKLKEISYVHAEAYAAGELKHGPLALVDGSMPVVVLCPENNLLEKLSSNIEEVKARHGQVYLLADHDISSQTCRGAKNTIEFEGGDSFISPIIFNVPLQLLAYHTAEFLGKNVDQPRNLAKSVTVE